MPDPELIVSDMETYRMLQMLTLCMIKLFSLHMLECGSALY